MISAAKIKKDFPIFQRKINGKPIVYLDSASTSQKPQQVIDAVINLYKNSNANIHRGIYTISEEATALFEGTREKVAKFINAASSSEIIFTHNATEALNIVAYGLGQKLQKGDAILLTEMEHHSNIVPWQRIAKERGTQLYYLSIDDNGMLTDTIVDHYDTRKYHSIEHIPRLKIVALTHVSNVLGTINPIEKITKAIRAERLEVSIVIDAAQSVPHMPVDVQGLDCDFLAFSGHKMLAPTGVGVLYGKKKLLEEMEPLLVGSHMISEVTKEGATWNDLPWKFEPGTAAIEAVVGLGAAIDYLDRIGMDKVRKHELGITNYALERLKKIDGVTLYGPRNTSRSHVQYIGISDIQRGGVISFNVDGIHSHDVAQILNEDNICIRSGHHCTMPLHTKLGIDSSCRASFYIYNDESDIDKLVEGIEKVKKVFKV